jgi:hypothetical protein
MGAIITRRYGVPRVPAVAVPLCWPRQCSDADIDRAGPLRALQRGRTVQSARSGARPIGRSAYRSPMSALACHPRDSVGHPPSAIPSSLLPRLPYPVCRTIAPKPPILYPPIYVLSSPKGAISMQLSTLTVGLLSRPATSAAAETTRIAGPTPRRPMSAMTLRPSWLPLVRSTRVRRCQRLFERRAPGWPRRDSVNSATRRHSTTRAPLLDTPDRLPHTTCSSTTIPRQRSSAQA